MMTQDRVAHGLATPVSPKNLNPTAPVFQQSPAGERSPSDSTSTGREAGPQGLLTNGDINANGANYLVPVVGSCTGLLSEAAPQPQGMLPVQNLSRGIPMGFTLTHHPQPAVSTHQTVATAAATQQQALYDVAVSDNTCDQRSQQVRASSQNSSPLGNGESFEDPLNAALLGGDEGTENTGDAEVLGGSIGGQDYPDGILAPIRKQMQFYFSSENLPNDKFLNKHMDSDKFIPLELFLDFGRIRPICNSIDQLMKAVESSSILELSEDRKKVRVSQCRKTLTLRGFPQSTTEEDVRQFILEMGAYPPTHIEFVMFKEKYSVWYVSFKDEAAALNSFFQFHNQKAVYKDHLIGCCIKSSGTLAAAGYFPSSEESNQRRLAYQNQAAAAASASVHAVQSPMPQPPAQQLQALMQPFSTMQLHSYMPGSTTSIYYQQTPQGSYMPYVAGMIQGWPGPTAAMEPGLIMQNNGLQPQHIRTSMPRAHIVPTGSSTQHRFSRPQRTRQGNLERSASERPSDRPPVVSMSGQSRSSPHSVDGSAPVTVTPQGAYVQRRTVQEEIAQPMILQPQVVSHQFVTPLVAQHQHTVTSATAPTVAINPSGHESGAVPRYQQVPHQNHQHHAVMAAAGTTSAPPPPAPQIASNPPPNTQQHLHHHSTQQQSAIPQQQHHGQHSHHHHQQPQPTHHHQQHYQQQHNNHAVPPHSGQHHNHTVPPPTQAYHHQQSSQAIHHQHHPHQQPSMMPHHHHSQQQHHQYLPPPQVPHHHQQHQQSPPGNRSEKRNRRRREDNVRNQRSDRGQSNRANYGSQAAVDNFTMEANSFPPLPGAQSSITNSEVSLENRMSDIVRGISRNSGSVTSGSQRATSNTPSPVATPVPVSVAAESTLGQHHHLPTSATVGAHIVEDGDLVLDDDATSSSQDDVDIDINQLESRVMRPESHLSCTAEPSMLPSHSRSQKVGASVASPVIVSTSRHSESHQLAAPMQAQGKGSPQTTHYYQQNQLIPPVAASSASEAPKLSYAQILAQKNREAANIAITGENITAGPLPPNLNSGTSNGPNSAANGNSAANSIGDRASNQSTNAFREHGNYQQQGPRSSQRGMYKDSTFRSDGPPQMSRQSSGGRRNSKENRTSNKFDRRKTDAHYK